MINFNGFLLTSVLILTLLISAIVISYTNKFIFVHRNLKKTSDQMYDPDYNRNISSLCIFSKEPYKILFEKSPCFNKTLVQWYNPWVRHELWIAFWKETGAKNGLRRMKYQQVEAEEITETQSPRETVLPTELPRVKEKAEIQKEKKKPYFISNEIFISMFLIYMMLTCWDFINSKIRKKKGAAAKAQERQCSLADFTINRHLRKESQQQGASNLPRQGSLELTAKVTQNLIHQSSLDRAFPKTISEGVTSLERRRNSMPLYFSNDISGTSFSPVLKPSKRQSMDVTGEEMSFDFRKKPRHFIRRH